MTETPQASGARFVNIGERTNVTGSARFKRRSRLLAALRERPTAWAACS